MTFCIITHVNHYHRQDEYFAYAPYVCEMNIWLKYPDKVIIVAPLNKTAISVIDIGYEHHHIDFRKVNGFSVTNIKNLFKAFITIPKISVEIYRAMKESDHIHLRCPGNMGLLAAIVQIVFPKKRKTAKYAGNWNPKAKQPLTYKLQKWILSNTFLTRNMQVLVYGEWENQTKNIKPFFTATYSELEKTENKPLTVSSSEVENREPNQITISTPFNLATTSNFLFVGTLSEGKRPLYAVQIVEQLQKKGIKAQLELCGEGALNKELEAYIKENNLDNVIALKGNLPKENIKEKYQNSHFLLLPSKSEGWPKVVAEAMFWGCVPLVTPVSCVPNMVDNGKRGMLLSLHLENDTKQIEGLILNESAYKSMSEKAISWSRKYTTEKFDEEIKKLLIN